MAADDDGGGDLEGGNRRTDPHKAAEEELRNRHRTPVGGVAADTGEGHHNCPRHHMPAEVAAAGTAEEFHIPHRTPAAGGGPAVRTAAEVAHTKLRTAAPPLRRPAGWASAGPSPVTGDINRMQYVGK